MTSNFYQVDNLWQGVICSSLCVLTFQVLRLINDDVLFENTTFNGFDLNVELVAFLTLGMLCGVRTGLLDNIKQLNALIVIVCFNHRLYTKNASSQYTSLYKQRCFFTIYKGPYRRSYYGLFFFSLFDAQCLGSTSD